MAARCGICGHDHGNDNPCCERCGHYNAMLGDRGCWAGGEWYQALKCRDCGNLDRSPLAAAAVVIGESNAGEAFDQRGAFDSPAEAIASYEQNALDSASELALDADETWAAFDRKVRDLFGSDKAGA